MITKEEFKNAKIEDTEKGLIYKGHCLMYKWEKPVIKESIRLICEKIKPESVLEIGFGYGYTASEFQKFGVHTHVIIEANKQIYEQAIEWAKDITKDGVMLGQRIEIILGTWQEVELDEEFDLLYFDPYHIIDERGEHYNKFNNKWLAEMFTESEEGGKENFVFEVDGTKYFQSLVKIK